MAFRSNQLTVDIKDQLTVAQGACEHQLMVETQEIRDAFSARLSAALDDVADIRPERGRNTDLHAALKRLGCTATKQATHKWLTGASVPERDNMELLAKLTGARIEWLEYGLGEQYAWDAASEVEGSPVARPTADLIKEMLEKHGKGMPAEARDQLLAIAEEAAPADVERPSNVIHADFSRPPIVGDEIRIAHYDVQGAMGGGRLVHDFPEMFRDVTVSQQHLRELGVTYKDPSHLKLITGDGQSMAPIIQHLDPLIVDVSIRDFAGDGIYAFTWQGLFYIKSLQMLDAEHFLMVSTDEKLYPPKPIRIDETYIQARVLLVWNAKRL